MGKSRPTYDVFVSHSFDDSKIAADVTRILLSCGLQVFVDLAIKPGDKAEDIIWEAMAESQALVVIIGEGEPSANVAFEVGAAKAWNKPIYGVASDPPTTPLPSGMHGLELYPQSRVKEIAQKIEDSSGALPPDEISALVEAYVRIDVAVDQLALQPKKLSELTRQFRKSTGRQIAGEQLLRLLLRLRKQHHLPTARKRNTQAK